MAKWICRTADRVDPARVYRSSDRAQRRAPKADPCEILRLLQWVASSCFARKGCAGRAPDRPLRGHRRTCNLGRIASPVRTYLVFGSDTGILCLKILQTLHLLGLEPSELLAPAIVRNLAHPDLADCVGNALALRDQDIDLPQLRDNFLRLVPLPRHIGPP